jgi:hypothetical protein
LLLKPLFLNEHILSLRGSESPLLVFAVFLNLDRQLFNEIFTVLFSLIVFVSHSPCSLSINVPSCSEFLDEGFGRGIFDFENLSGLTDT